MERSAPHHLQHIGMQIACAVIYSQVAGTRTKQLEPVQQARVLNDVAHALAMVATIYARDAVSADLRPIPAADLLAGIFSDGGRRFTTASGVTMDDLTVQRGEVFTAIKLFKAMRADFQRAS